MHFSVNINAFFVNIYVFHNNQLSVHASDKVAVQSESNLEKNDVNNMQAAQSEMVMLA